MSTTELDAMLDSTKAALDKVVKILESTHIVQKQHNIMLLDLYERIVKLEEKMK